MDAMQANSAVRGLVFAVQKVRSDLRESIGGDAVGEAILAELDPFVFGPDSALPHLLAWQARCAKSGVIQGADLFNFVKLLEMKSPMTLAILPVYGYTELESDIAWFTQTWPYLTDGLS